MDINQDKIIDVILTSFHQKKFNYDLSEQDYRILRANQLSGLIYSSIKDHLPQKEFQMDYYQYIKVDEAQKQLIEELTMIFNVSGIDFVFLKGSFLKTLYPYSYMRPMGDIDVLIRPESLKQVHQVLQEHQFKLWIESTNHDCFLKNKINVEIHPKLDSDFSPDYGDLFLKPWTYAKQKNQHQYELEIEYRFFYQCYHMIKHLYHSGVGFRTLIDLHLLLKLIDREGKVFKDIYHLFPKKDFIDFIIQLNDEIFKKQKTDIDQELKDDFIHYLLTSGTHGIGDDFNLFIGGMATEHHDKGWIVWTKFKFLLSKVFLNFNQMKGSYPYLKKLPFLLPFAYVQRIFRLIFKKRSRAKLKRMNAKKEEIEYVDQLFTRIGIKDV